MQSTSLLAAMWAVLACACASTAAAPAPGREGPAAPAAVSPETMPPHAARADDSLPAWLTADPAAKTVHLTLETAPSAAGPAINGHRAGDVRIVVPLGWKVSWSWTNRDSSSAHSLVVMQEREKLPEQGGRAALTNAMTRMVTAGMRPGQTDETTFDADQAGWYWLLCGVPTHALEGEWIGLKVDPEAKAPSFVKLR
jgi:hypothetical protein